MMEILDYTNNEIPCKFITHCSLHSLHVIVILLKHGHSCHPNNICILLTDGPSALPCFGG